VRINELEVLSLPLPGSTNFLYYLNCFNEVDLEKERILQKGTLEPGVPWLLLDRRTQKIQIPQRSGVLYAQLLA